MNPDFLDILPTAHGIEILKYLRPIDVLVLSKVCRTLRSWAKRLPDFRDSLFKFLKDKVYSPSNLIQMVSLTESIISGSIILQVLYDEEWVSSDIDIYTLTESKTCHEANPEMCYYKGGSFEYPDEFRLVRNLFFHGYCFIKSDWTDSPIESNRNLAHILCFIERYGFLPFISMRLARGKVEDGKLAYLDEYGYPHFDGLSDPEIKGLPINQIFIPGVDEKTKPKIEIILDQIDRYFDLSCCKVAFDGSKLYIRNFDDVVKRQTQVDLDFTKYRVTEKLDFPVFEGEHPVFKLRSFESQAQLLIDHVKKRKEKYENRGFTIID